MTDPSKPNRISIEITTYNNFDIIQRYKQIMTEDYDTGKFVCSICLNTKKCKSHPMEGQKNTGCLICHRHSDFNTKRRESKADRNSKDKTDVVELAQYEIPKPSAKTVQTSQTDVVGLNLLNEVLTVFQNKKLENSSHNSRTVLLKDACVSTEHIGGKVKPLSRPKLAQSKIFQYSIEDHEMRSDNHKFTIVNYAQPDVYNKNEQNKDFYTHKSSSYPQMKMEELKNSLKTNLKRRDTIEEVNRMFATVNKNVPKIDDAEFNRPQIRSGPRVLPVVKTKGNKGPVIKDNDAETGSQNICRDCQTNVHCLSAGDSDMKVNCTKCKNFEGCDRCGCVMFYHRKNKQRLMQGGMIYCECCQKRSKNCYDNRKEVNDDVKDFALGH